MKRRELLIHALTVVGASVLPASTVAALGGSGVSPAYDPAFEEIVFGKNLYVSLHTSDPLGEDLGDESQTRNEVEYRGYERVAVTRSPDSWKILEGAVYAKHPIVFSEYSGKPVSVTHIGVGTESVGEGSLLASAALGDSLYLTAGTILRLNELMIDP